MKGNWIKLASCSAVALLAMAMPAAAQITTSACPSFPDPQVNIQTRFQDPSYNFGQSLIKLRQMAQVDSAAIFHEDQPVGLASGELSFTREMRTNIALSNVDGRFCARPQSVTIKVEFPRNVIYVARELPRGSCAHNEILTHEEGHVEIDRELLTDYAPQMEGFVRIALTRMGTVRGTTQQEVEQNVQNLIDEQLEKAANEINRERSRRQAAHDSPQEYKRLSKVCDGVIPATVARFTDQTGTATSASATANNGSATQNRGTATPRFTRY